ncbi:MAG: cytoplasmic protein [Chloroflexi bacterium]|nr:cytoplasmic protein [Chloroflexota bacterium]
MSEKVALFVFAGPEIPCRLMHALVFALDLQARGGEAKIVLEGEAPGWLLALPNPKHKMHGMYGKAKAAGLIDAVCRACAVQAGAVEAAEEEGLRLANDAMGHVSLAPYLEAGFTIATL